MYPKLRFKSRMSMGKMGYTAALVLTEKSERERGDLTIEPRPVWREVVRVSEKVVRRRPSN